MLISSPVHRVALTSRVSTTSSTLISHAMLPPTYIELDAQHVALTKVQCCPLSASRRCPSTRLLRRSCAVVLARRRCPRRTPVCQLQRQQQLETRLPTTPKQLPNCDAPLPMSRIDPRKSTTTTLSSKFRAGIEIESIYKPRSRSPLGFISSRWRKWRPSAIVPRIAGVPRHALQCTTRASVRSKRRYLTARSSRVSSRRTNGICRRCGTTSHRAPLRCKRILHKCQTTYCPMH